jgi:hypothetical protein
MVTKEARSILATQKYYASVHKLSSLGRLGAQEFEFPGIPYYYYYYYYYYYHHHHYVLWPVPSSDNQTEFA